MRRTTRFRRLVEAADILVLPGIQDALTAKIAEKAGFEAITCGGYSTTASLLGKPDTSQLGVIEMADHYARICDAVEVPVFADGDTGFGNVTNVRRTMRAYERAGVAGLFIEDQIFPKRCGHMAGKAVVPVEEMVAKLKAALDARQDDDLVIMARTDALAVNGIDDAIERGQIYREVGADMIFVEAPRDEEQMLRICREIEGPCMANNIEGGLTPLLPASRLQEIGYAMVAHPVMTSYAVAAIVSRLMRTLRETGTTASMEGELLDFEGFNALVGLPELREAEQKDLDFAREFIAKR
jgi:2,3-dimethylmalate lyase